MQFADLSIGSCDLDYAGLCAGVAELHNVAGGTVWACDACFSELGRRGRPTASQPASRAVRVAPARCATPRRMPRRNRSGERGQAALFAIGRGLVALVAIAVMLSAPWQVAIPAGIFAAIVLRTSWFLLAYTGLALIRWWVVVRTRPYRDALGPAGRVGDPQAPWRQWLDTRCHSCGV